MVPEKSGESEKRKMRKFYAEKCEYGLNVSYSSLNGNAYTFYAFDSKKERDEFVDKNCYDSVGNVVAGSTTLETVRRVFGRNFIVYNNQCFKNRDEILEV